MDPNETLRGLREITSAILDDETARTMDAFANLEAMTDAFAALDEWLSKGGFLPNEWSHRV